MNRLDQRRRLDALKSTISLADLVERDGHKLVRNGSLWKLCCPFHRERTPSCYLWDDHGHCFGCSAHFDIFHYVMLRDGCGFREAVEKLENGHGRGVSRVVKRVIHRPKEPELPKDYFETLWTEMAESNGIEELGEFSKSLGLDCLQFNRLGVVWSNRDMAWAFPMTDHTLNIVGIRLRDKNGKKWAVKGSKQGLFIPETQPDKDLYVTEGPTDCAAMLSMGLFAIGKAAAMQGPEEIVKFIVKNRIRRVIVIADNDTAGLRGAKKLIEVCPVPCCELVLPAKDAREFYRNGGTRELVEALLRSAVWRTPKHAKMDQ